MIPSHLNKFIQRFDETSQPKLAQSIKKTALEFDQAVLNQFDYRSNVSCLLLGNVQSGKTVHMTGIIAKAADEHFPLFLVLTMDSISVYQQTLERIRGYLPDFCVCGEIDDVKFIENNLRKPVVTVLKKNYRVLGKWLNVLAASSKLKGMPFIIIDDEADAASLNTAAGKDAEPSKIYKNLNSIRELAHSCIYLQVTGTPQALYLQSAGAPMRPKFTVYFEPGDGYLGGSFFFPEHGEVPQCISLINDDDEDFDNFLVHHLGVSALIFLSGGTVSNALIHPSSRMADHENFRKKTEERLKFFKDHDNAFAEKLKNFFLEADPEKSSMFSWKKVAEKARRLLDDAKVLVMNSNNSVEMNDYAQGCSIIIGGNSLSRGVTFPALNTIFYTRISKNPQADTIWQHSRMFGYDRDPGVVRVYMPALLFKLFRDLNATNSSLIAQVTKDGAVPSIYYPKGIKPTRSAVIDKSRINLLAGGTNYFPFDPENDDISKLDKMLSSYDDKQKYVRISIDEGISILSHISAPAHDFDSKAFAAALKMIKNNDPEIRMVLAVRRERDIAKGTGAMLSPDDYELSKSFDDEQVPVLIMYKVTGTKGWGGNKLWIPNIRLPRRGIYSFAGES